MVGSLSHHGSQGLEGCTEDLVACLFSVRARMGREVEAMPLFLVPLGGVEAGSWLSDLFDLETLTYWCNLQNGVKIDPKPNRERGDVTTVMSSRQGRTVLVDASYKYMPTD
jgi:hypothetical protein